MSRPASNLPTSVTRVRESPAVAARSCCLTVRMAALYDATNACDKEGSNAKLEIVMALRVASTDTGMAVAGATTAGGPADAVLGRRGATGAIDAPATTLLPLGAIGNGDGTALDALVAVRFAAAVCTVGNFAALRTTGTGAGPGNVIAGNPSADAVVDTASPITLGDADVLCALGLIEELTWPGAVDGATLGLGAAELAADNDATEDVLLTLPLLSGACTDAAVLPAVRLCNDCPHPSAEDLNG